MSLLGVAGDTDKEKSTRTQTKESKGTIKRKRHLFATPSTEQRYGTSTRGSPWLQNLVMICRCRTSKTTRGRRNQRTGEQNCAHM